MGGGPEVQPVKQEIIRDEAGRFVPGHSGNPTGKPVGTLDYQRRFFNEFVKPILQDGAISDRDRYQVILDRIFSMASSGNIRAIELILEYLLPKQKNEVELSGGIGVLTYSDVLRILKGEKIEDEHNTGTELTESN